MKCFCCQKWHQRNDYPLWKQHLEHEIKNSWPKVGVNVDIVELCIPIIRAFVATLSQWLKERQEENIMKDNSPTKERLMKWDREKAIHQELVGEIQRIQAEMDVPTQLYPYT